MIDIRFRQVLILIFCIVLVATLPTPLLAGWTVTYLDPGGPYARSMSEGVSGGQQSGAVCTTPGGNIYLATIWNSTAASSVDINPVGCWSSGLHATSGNQQVGTAVGTITNDRWHAGLWNGTADGWIDLNPAGSYESDALSIWGDQQIGWTKRSSTDPWRASLWTGTAASWVDLHPSASGGGPAPTGYSESVANCVWDGKQVGSVIGRSTNAQAHASMWSGTAASMVDMNPTGYLASALYGIWGDQQVGSVYLDIFSKSHAALWTGTATSCVDLNPAGYNQSWAYGVSSGWQVGWATKLLYGNKHASLWNGTSMSWVDMQGYLTADYISSEARAIEVVGNEIWVVGSAINQHTGNNEAILWHFVPEPTSMAATLVGLLALVPAAKRMRRSHLGLG